jgi:hypothetical protein
MYLYLVACSTQPHAQFMVIAADDHHAKRLIKTGTLHPSAPAATVIFLAKDDKLHARRIKGIGETGDSSPGVLMSTQDFS